MIMIMSRVLVAFATVLIVAATAQAARSLPAKIGETLSPSEISVQGGEVQGP